MTYRSELMTRTSCELYHMLATFVWNGGDLEGADEELYIKVGETKVDDESYKDALIDLVERLHDDDLL